ncbi:MAG TPA: hypothetical protein DHV14_00215 [Micrococcales bacterium]|nr:hypothetical protein [Micrococcales bacterium]
MRRRAPPGSPAAPPRPASPHPAPARRRAPPGSPAAPPRPAARSCRPRVPRAASPVPRVSRRPPATAGSPRSDVPTGTARAATRLRARPRTVRRR